MFRWIRTLPIWIRFVGAFGVAVVAATGSMIFRGTRQQPQIGLGNEISAIQQGTQGTVSAIQQIGRIINRVNDTANTIASAVSQFKYHVGAGGSYGLTWTAADFCAFL